MMNIHSSIQLTEHCRGWFRVCRDWSHNCAVKAKKKVDQIEFGTCLELHKLAFKPNVAGSNPHTSTMT